MIPADIVPDPLAEPARSDRMIGLINGALTMLAPSLDPETYAIVEDALLAYLRGRRTHTE